MYVHIHILKIRYEQSIETALKHKSRILIGVFPFPVGSKGVIALRSSFARSLRRSLYLCNFKQTQSLF